MQAPHSFLTTAAGLLAKTYDELVGGGSCYVEFMGCPSPGRYIILVAWSGSELVRAMQVEGFLLNQGETILRPSFETMGRTLLFYQMKGRP